MDVRDPSHPDGEGPAIPENVARAVRRASGPPAAAGAAARIADGAWERARSGTLGRRWRLLPGAARPLSVAAAAALLLAAGLTLLPSSGPVFAVERGRVQVLRDGRWHDARRVAPGETARAAGGTSLTGPDASSIRPGRDGLFRVEGTTGQDMVVRVLDGAFDVEGTSLRLVAGGVRVERDERVPAFGVHVELGDGVTSDRTGGDSPTVRVFRGLVRLSTGTDTLNLTRDETARLVPAGTTAGAAGGTGGPGTPGRLALVARWTDDLPARLLRSGSVPVHVRLGGKGPITVLCSPQGQGAMLDVEIPDDLLTTALPQLNVYTALFALPVRRQEAGGSCDPLAVFALARRVERVMASEIIAEYTHTAGDRTTRIRVLEDGYALLDPADGSPTREYPGLAALRAAEPGVAALFGDRLR